MPGIESVIEQCVQGLGYELVELEFAGRGLLRVSIDVPGSDPRALLPLADETLRRVQLEDCETVNRQLSHVLTVEDFDYARLEVASPGLDRPLRKQEDYARFVGFTVALKLRVPFKGRRNFEGVLAAEADGKFSVELDAQPLHGVVGKSKQLLALKLARQAKAKPKAKSAAQSRSKGEDVSKQRTGSEQEELVTKLVFSLDEVEKTRLVPVV